MHTRILTSALFLEHLKMDSYSTASLHAMAGAAAQRAIAHATMPREPWCEAWFCGMASRSDARF
jgi:hypothetical protein